MSPLQLAPPAAHRAGKDPAKRVEQVDFKLFGATERQFEVGYRSMVARWAR